MPQNQPTNDGSPGSAEGTEPRGFVNPEAAEAFASDLAAMEAGETPAPSQDTPTPEGQGAGTAEPQTPPEQTPPAEPAPQGIPPGAPQAATPSGQSEPLILGKYRSMEEAERGYQELEAKLGQQGQELGETRRQLELYRPMAMAAQAQQTGPQGQQGQPGQQAQREPILGQLGEEEFVKLQSDPEYFRQSINLLAERTEERVIDRVRQELSTAITTAQRNSQIRESFYQQNQDLVGQEGLVGMVTNHVMAMYPNHPIESLLPTIAQAARQYAGQQANAGTSPGGVGGNGGQVAPAAAPSGGAQFSERGSGGRGPAAPVISPTQREIFDLLQR